MRLFFPHPYSRGSASSRVVLLCFGVATLAACGSDSPTVPPVTPVLAPTFVRLESDPGDYVGGGQTHEYNRTNSLIKVSERPDHLELTIAGGQQWQMDAILGNTLRTGTWTNLPRYRFGVTAASFAWSGDGRGCATSTSTVTIDKVQYVDGFLAALDMRVDQHCDGATPALHITIHLSD